MDIKELKDKINTRKSEILSQSNVLGEKVRVPVSSDSVLHELLEASKTGRPTKAIEKIKAVNNLANKKKNNGVPSISGGAGLSEVLGSHNSTTGNNSMTHPPQATQSLSSETMHERDKLFEQNLNNASSSLSQSLSQYQTQSQPNYYQNQQMQQMPSQQINEQQIAQSVNKALNENISVMVQEVMKSTIMEMYEADKIKNALLENKEMIKKIVRETIIELSKHKKSTS